jgi:hypothetical protein
MEPDHPYHYGLLALMERYCGWLDFNNATGDIMAESRGGKEECCPEERVSRIYRAVKAFWGKNGAADDDKQRDPVKTKGSTSRIAVGGPAFAHSLTRDVSAFGREKIGGVSAEE